MYFQESRATVTNNFLTFTMCQLPGGSLPTSQFQSSTSVFGTDRLDPFAEAANNEDSAPIRFSFDEVSSVGEGPLFTFEDLKSNEGDGDQSSVNQSTHAVFTYPNEHECTFNQVSPNTPASPKNAVDTQSSSSKELLADPEATTSQAKVLSQEDKELIQILRTVSDAKTDLNKFVEDLLFQDEPEADLINEDKIEVTTTHKKRMRKSTFQVKILEEELRVNPTWSKEDIRSVCKKSGLAHHQVYKWYWDQQRKAGFKPSSW
jgi:hypothetical protein